MEPVSISAIIAGLSEGQLRQALQLAAAAAPDAVAQALNAVDGASDANSLDLGTEAGAETLLHRRKRQRIDDGSGAAGTAAARVTALDSPPAARSPIVGAAPEAENGVSTGDDERAEGGECGGDVDDITAAATIASAAAGTAAASKVAPGMGGAAAVAKSKRAPSERGFDMSRYRQRHVALHVAYLGHDYFGFAAQQAQHAVGRGASKGRRQGSNSTAAATAAAKGAGPGAADAGDILSTIESHLFTALVRGCLIESRETSGYTRCGRTDRGVSAGGQVLAMRLRSKARRLDAGLDGTVRASPAISAETEVSASTGTTVAADVVLAAAGAANGGQAEGDDVDMTGGRGGGGSTCVEGAGGGDDDIDDEAGSEEGEEGGNEGGKWRLWQRHDGLANTGEPFPPPAEEVDYAFALNMLLPPDIRVLGWADVGERFSARFSASTRSYRYFFPGRDLDLAAMADAGARLVGTHDFRNLCKVDVRNTQHFVRQIMSVRIVRAGDEDWAGGFPTGAFAAAQEAQPAPAGASASATAVAPPSRPTPLAPPRGAPDGSTIYYLEVVGRAFVWHQIRCIVAVLFHVGRGYEAPSIVDHLLDVTACTARPQYAMAGEAPLLLMHCGYGEAEAAGAWVTAPVHSAPPAPAASAAAAPAAAAAAAAGGAGAPASSSSAPTSRSAAIVLDANGDRPGQFVRRDVGLFSRMHHSPAALRRATLDLEAQWSVLAIKAAMLRALISRLHALPVARADVVAALQGTMPGAGKKHAAHAKGTGPAVAALLAEAAGSAAPGAEEARFLRWGDVVRVAGGIAAARAGLRPQAWAADAEYLILGLPPRHGHRSHHGTVSGSGAAIAAAVPRAGGGGGYKPLVHRPTGMSVAEQWGALAEEKRARIRAMHPVNAPKLEAEVDRGQQQRQQQAPSPRHDQAGHADGASEADADASAKTCGTRA
jgi:tRNA U38,U39,U40 pseudouridine synthase TruA